MWITTVPGSGVSMRFTVVKTLDTIVFTLGSYVRSIENFTSSDVQGSPLWNLTPGRSLKVQVVGAVAFHSVASPGWSLPSGWRLVRLSKTLKVTRMSFDEVEKCGSSFEMSPPWAMTSSRFWVVWAAAGLAARPSSRAAAAAPTPSAAARSRKARRERVPACHASTRVRKSIRSLLRVVGCQGRAGRRSSSSRRRRATRLASSPRRQWGSTRSSPRWTRTMIGGSPRRRACMTASGVRPVTAGSIDEEQGRRGPHGAVLLEAGAYARDARRPRRGSGAPRRGGAPTRRRGPPGGTARGRRRGR